MKSPIMVLSLLSLGTALNSPGLAAESASLRVARQGNVLEIIARVPAGIAEAEIRIESERNKQMSKISDISPLVSKTAPVPTVPAKPAAPFDREIFYPVVDVALQPGMEGVLEFSAAPKTVFINQNFFKATVVPAQEIGVPANRRRQVGGCLPLAAKHSFPAQGALRSPQLRNEGKRLSD